MSPPLNTLFPYACIVSQALCGECALFTVAIQVRVHRGVGGTPRQQRTKGTQSCQLYNCCGVFNTCGSTGAADGSGHVAPTESCWLRFRMQFKVFINRGKRVAESEVLAIVSLTRDSFFLLCWEECVRVRACVWRGEAAGDARGGALWRSLPCAPGVLSLQCLNGETLPGPRSAALARSPRLIPGFQQLLWKLFRALGLRLCPCGAAAAVEQAAPRCSDLLSPPPTRG